jgi:hypothetical protein
MDKRGMKGHTVTGEASTTFTPPSVGHLSMGSADISIVVITVLLLEFLSQTVQFIVT